MLDPGADALGLASGERVKVANLNDVFLEHREDRLWELTEAVAFEVVEERDAEHLLILRLHNPQVGTDGLALVRLEVVEQVRLD